MIQTLNTYTDTAKTAEIMARYRPIAPKPDSSGPVDAMNDDSSLPHSIRKSPYLRNVWPHLQARPTRTRKRGRPGLAPPASSKRARTCLQELAAPPFQATVSPPAKSLSLQGFVHSLNGMPHQVSVLPLKCGLDTPVTTPSKLITLPLLSCASSLAFMVTIPAKSSETNGNDQVIDLNKEADVLEELDFMQRLEGPTRPGIISPKAVRPVGSTIVIDGIKEDPGGQEAIKERTLNRPEDVEKEVESQNVPVVVSDSNNKVRLENSAYKELVGQPECCWLDYMPCSSDSKHGGGARKRIGGEVLLQFLDYSTLPILSNGFTCRVKIEWGSNESEKHSVNAFCEATRLGCHKDYVFQWRFHIN